MKHTDFHQLNLNILPTYPNSKMLLKDSRIKTDNRLPLPILNSYLSKGFNLALVPGLANNGKYLIVLDFDNIVEYLKWRKEFNHASYEVSTRRGKHIYFWLNEAPHGKPVNCELKYEAAIMLSGSTVKKHLYSDNGLPIATVDNLEDCVKVIVPATPELQGEKERSIIDWSKYSGYGKVFSPPVETRSEAKRNIPFNAIKQQVDLVDYINGYLPADKHAKKSTGFIGCHCPKHQSKGEGRKSLSINADKKICFCHNPACELGQRWLDIIGLHSVMAGKDNYTAAVDLADRFFIL